MSAARLSFNSEALREAWKAELWRALGIALEAPERAAPDQAGKRRVRVQGFPHFVIYHWEPPILRVLAIAHGSREPGYWSDRT